MSQQRILTAEQVDNLRWFVKDSPFEVDFVPLLDSHEALRADRDAKQQYINKQRRDMPAMGEAMVAETSRLEAEIAKLRALILRQVSALEHGGGTGHVAAALREAVAG